MFVSAKKYRALERELEAAQLQASAARAELDCLERSRRELSYEIAGLRAERETLMGRYLQSRNEFYALLNRDRGAVFSPDELRTLLSLCHPDKHGGREVAVRMTQRLIELRKEARRA